MWGTWEGFHESTQFVVALDESIRLLKSFLVAFPEGLPLLLKLLFCCEPVLKLRPWEWPGG
jgi:hypothetical protein